MRSQGLHGAHILNAVCCELRVLEPPHVCSFHRLIAACPTSCRGMPALAAPELAPKKRHGMQCSPVMGRHRRSVKGRQWPTSSRTQTQ